MELDGRADGETDTGGMEHPTQDEVAAFLVQQTGETPTDLEPLTGGAWSSAWAFRTGAEELVVRFGPERSWYEADQMAAAFSGPDLPIPQVREVGTTSTGLAYAISMRRHGAIPGRRTDRARRCGRPDAHPSACRAQPGTRRPRHPGDVASGRRTSPELARTRPQQAGGRSEESGARLACGYGGRPRAGGPGRSRLRPGAGADRRLPRTPRPGARRPAARQRAGEPGLSPGRSGHLLEALATRRLSLRRRLVQCLGTGVLPGDRRHRPAVRPSPRPQPPARREGVGRRRRASPLLCASDRFHPPGLEPGDLGPGAPRRHRRPARRDP